MTECYVNNYSLKNPNCLQELVGDEDDTYLAVEFFTLALQYAIYQALVGATKTTSNDKIIELVRTPWNGVELI